MVFDQTRRIMTVGERQEHASALKREMNCCQAVARAFALPKFGIFASGWLPLAADEAIWYNTRVIQNSIMQKC